MKKLIVAACMALGLVACGGGGGPGQLAESTPLASSDAAAASLRAKVAPVPDPTLAAQAVSVVNTTTAGDQLLRAVGALTDGGYTVAWISDNTTLFIQRYDAAGSKVGTETTVPLSVAGTPGGCIPTNCDAAVAIRDASVAVLADGTVVTAYQIDRPAGQVGAFFQFLQGIYIQRFDANGTQLMGETTVFSRIGEFNRNNPFLRGPVVAPLTDGGFVVGWRSATGSSFGIIGSFSTQRYDSNSQTVGPIVTTGSLRMESLSGPGFSLAADASGGYTLTFPHLDAAFNRVVSAIHHDATGTATLLVASRFGSALSLPLEGDRFALFTSDSSGSFRQFLDSAGNPVGSPTPIASMPTDARELADGSFVLFFDSSGATTAQRFDSTGAPMGSLLTLQTGGGIPAVAALANSGFAAAWSAAGTGGDLDVFTQRFIEALTRDQAAIRAKRKACIASAKGMTGQERKAFMEACMR